MMNAYSALLNRHIRLCILLLFLWLPPVIAQEGHFINRWLTLGPIVEGKPAPEAIVTDYIQLASGISESELATLEHAPSMGQELVVRLDGYATQIRTWTVLELGNDGDVNQILVEHSAVDDAVAYFTTFVEATNDVSKELWLGSDDSIAVWLNGRQIHLTAADRSLVPDEERVSVRLVKGLNALLVKVADSKIDWKVSVRFASDEGLRFFVDKSKQSVPSGAKPSQLPSYKPESHLIRNGCWWTYPYVNGNSDVRTIALDKEGVLWVGTWRAGIARYDGTEWQRFTETDGLASNVVLDIIVDEGGVVWVGTSGGISRYDGKEWQSFTQAEGLPNNVSRALAGDKQGYLWVGTDRGVARYDGQNWHPVTAPDGPGDKAIASLAVDKNWNVWIGARDHGIWRYDGQNWQHFTDADGLVGNEVRSMATDGQGAIWIGTRSGGLSHYDGKTGQWRSFKAPEPLPDHYVHALAVDRKGVLWVGTEKGLSCYDGKTWRTLTEADGLPDNHVRALAVDREGGLWVGMERGGISRYDDVDSKVTPHKVPPLIHIRQVDADRIYEKPNAPLSLPEITQHVRFSYRGISFKTRPGQMRYIHRLIGTVPADWQGSTSDETVTFSHLTPGTYTFQVKAIDSDLNVSEPPASLEFTISPPPPLPFYQRTIFVAAVSSAGGLLLVIVIFLAVQHWRLSRAEKHRLRQELDDARQMQQNLLPKTAPTVTGFDIAGFSQPAREVGGDFYDYLILNPDLIGIVLADVSGKGLRSAMNAVLTDGMLHEVAKIEKTPGEILAALNTDLRTHMPGNMFTALNLGLLDAQTKRLTCASAGMPYPILMRENEVEELEQSGFPLGRMANLSYHEKTVDLQAGDYVILYTDGISEAMNETEEMYGVERLLDAVRRTDSHLTAEAMLQHILQDVQVFVGKAEPYDDMTLVVVRCVDI
ncbi:SpoIIE family protein phosphatase [Candidatus Poribacteria bacterium]|nr:SpoIIE family protein phosphatase [Candidatus Poribacteria bacterium]